MSWIELKLDFPQDRLEDVSAYLFALGCEGINVTDSGIVIYFSTHRWTGEIQKGIVEYLRHFHPGFSKRRIQVTALTDHDWMTDWKKGFRPIRVGAHVVVKPPWEDYRIREGEHVLTINPKMAFGTGHHESTKLMIIELEKTVKPGMQVLDVGTGSGILAILADKLQAGSVLAIDNDMEAIRNSQENAGLNELSGKMMFALGDPSQLPPDKYDLILANINRNVLLQFADTFVQHLKPGGRIILSGLLLTDEFAVLEAYRNAGCRLLRKSAMKEWLAMVLESERKTIDEKSGRDRYRDKFDIASNSAQ
jgi:ribosomal protein L11 methyltransferase